MYKTNYPAYFFGYLIQFLTISMLPGLLLAYLTSFDFYLMMILDILYVFFRLIMYISKPGFALISDLVRFKSYFGRKTFLFIGYSGYLLSYILMIIYLQTVILFSAFFLYDLFMRIFYRYIVEPTYIFKLLIIGDREVGRSTFLRESVDDNFFVEDHIETVGVDIYRKELTLEERTVDFMIWNVSNKEMFRRDLRPFISGSNAVILIFDLTNLNSLDYLSEFPKMVREYAGDIPIHLVGNKVDLEEGREVSRDLGTAFARHNDLAGYIEISAKTRQDCEKTFEVLVENILTQFQIQY